MTPLVLDGELTDDYLGDAVSTWRWVAGLLLGLASLLVFTLLMGWCVAEAVMAS